jgi:hypothetical protein|nr:hypothetical protein [Kofleriaceae bacterium]
MSVPAVPLWDTNGTNVIATIAGHETDGWASNETPSSSELNGWMRLVYGAILWGTGTPRLPAWEWKAALPTEATTGPLKANSCTLDPGGTGSLECQIAGGGNLPIRILPKVGEIISGIGMVCSGVLSHFKVELRQLDLSTGASDVVATSVDFGGSSITKGEDTTITPVTILDGCAYYLNVTNTNGVAGANDVNVYSVGYRSSFNV